MEEIYVANMTMDDMLQHHGILGMKWGVRRYQNKDGSLTSAGKRRLAKLQGKRAELEEEEERLTNKPAEHKPKNPHVKNKSLFELDDDELQKEVDRLKLEQKYHEYMKELYPSKRKEPLVDGRRLAGDIMSGAIRNVGTAVATEVTGRSANKLGRALGLEYDIYKVKKQN